MWGSLLNFIAATTRWILLQPARWISERCYGISERCYGILNIILSWSTVRHIIDVNQPIEVYVSIAHEYVVHYVVFIATKKIPLKIAMQGLC
jgi:hypothetical protein